MALKSLLKKGYDARQILDFIRITVNEPHGHHEHLTNGRILTHYERRFEFGIMSVLTRDDGGVIDAWVR